MHPVINIKRMVNTFTEVKVLFSRLLSFTPKANNAVIAMTIRKEKKSGYSPRNETSKVMRFLKNCDIWFPAKESTYPLSPLATLEVPITYSSTRFQPMVKATNSPTDT